MMTKKMQQAAEKLGLDYDIKAFPYAKIRDEGPKADVILLGPQIRYNLSMSKGLSNNAGDPDGYASVCRNGWRSEW